MSRIIQISELNFTTREGRRILEDVHLSVMRGELVGVVGPPGAGKSLLLDLLAGEAKPRTGQILVNDRNVTRLSRTKLLRLRQQLGVLPQHPVWPRRLSVEEALRFKLGWLGLSSRQAERKVEEVVSLLALGSLRGQGFPELNALERRTAYLALALCHDPVMFLCDDPFSELGEEGALTFTRGLATVHQQRGLTTVLASRETDPIHRLEGRVVQLENGTLREDH